MKAFKGGDAARAEVKRRRVYPNDDMPKYGGFFPKAKTKVSRIPRRYSSADQKSAYKWPRHQSEETEQERAENEEHIFPRVQH